MGNSPPLRVIEIPIYIGFVRRINNAFHAAIWATVPPYWVGTFETGTLAANSPTSQGRLRLSFEYLTSSAGVRASATPDRIQSEYVGSCLKPTVLIATTFRWNPTVRLAMALAKAGFAVEMVCPPGHPISKTHAARKLHTFRGLAPVTSLYAAITAAKPEILVSGDDLATWHLHQLYDREKNKGAAGKSICELIERSFGPPESFPVVYARATFMQMAEQEGLRVPKTKLISNADELKNWIATEGFPTALKANGTFGGAGVKIVGSLEDAQAAFKILKAPPLLARAAKRALLDRDRTLVWPSLLRHRAVVNAQAFVAGREATSAVACHKGRILASLHFEVLCKTDAAGPASVLRRIDHPEMAFAAEKMVRRLNLSGIHGFDFMLEAQTKHAYLIEINPRATQIGHLTLGPGRDLPAALFASVAGGEVHPAPKLTENSTVALFPREWLRDPQSKFLLTAYHDVPWDEPEFIRAVVGQDGQKGIERLRKNSQQDLTAQISLM
jgi:Carbamoyl-phosphate synthase L chain, ATP binding domain